MRILTVRQPWAAAIIHPSINPTNGAMRVKDVENRTTNIAGDYRGPVAIHVAKAWDEVAFKRPSGVLKAWWDWQLASDLGRGHIIGVVDLVDVHHSLDCAEGNYGSARCSAWAEPSTYHLVLANPRPLAEPIPFKGALGLRHLDPDAIALIESRLS